jgi:hypothetical protein
MTAFHVKHGRGKRSLGDPELAEQRDGFIHITTHAACFEPSLGQRRR